MTGNPRTVSLELFQILRQFAAVVPISQIYFPPHLITQSTHDFLLRLICENPHFEAFPPAFSYRRSFWKWTIRHLESNPDIDIDPNFYTALTVPDENEKSHSTLSFALRLPKPPAPSFVTYYWRTNADLSSDSKELSPNEYITATLLESRTVIESGTTGLRTWLASFHLAHFLISHPDNVQAKRVLELGSGSGFLGIIVGSLQAIQNNATTEPTRTSDSSMLFLTDVNTEVLERCMSNVKLPCNTLTSSSRWINCSTLDWMSSLASDTSAIRKQLQTDINCDIVIGADIVYDPSLVPALVATLCIALECVAPQPSRARYALIALNVRNAETYSLFRNSIEASGLSIEELENPRQGNLFLEVANWSIDQVDGVRLMKITK